MFFFTFIGLFHSFCKNVQKKHLMFRSPGSTTYHLASVQQAKAFGAPLPEFDWMVQ
jgi:hypothetical protein